MTMLARKAHPLPEAFGWLPAGTDQLRRRILMRSLLDVGILEEPRASNRGPRIDAYLRRAFTPEPIIEAGKGYWCAAAVGAWWMDAGAKVPRDHGSCDAWLPYLVPCTLATLATLGQPGDAVLYGKPGDAVHIGILWRLSPQILSCEGNRGLGATSTNNGTAVDVHEVTRGDVLGVVRPITAVA
jgi:hypothetical protein